MRLSEFWTRMDQQFGPQTRQFAQDHVLTELGRRTVNEALAAGLSAREVWDGVCVAMEIPVLKR